jgi:hypothetical protein
MKSREVYLAGTRLFAASIVARLCATSSARP